MMGTGECARQYLDDPIRIGNLREGSIYAPANASHPKTNTDSLPGSTSAHADDDAVWTVERDETIKGVCYAAGNVF
jgi:hypothetical protein